MVAGDFNFVFPTLPEDTLPIAPTKLFFTDLNRDSEPQYLCSRVSGLVVLPRQTKCFVVVIVFNDK